MTRRIRRLIAVEGPRDQAAFAERFGITYRSLLRIERKGSVAFWTADRVCASLGLHPSAVWSKEELDGAS